MSTSNLIAYYTFDNQTANDYIGDYDGSFESGATTSTDIPNTNGYSATFDGIDDFINLSTNPLQNYSSLTISIWMKTTDTEGRIIQGRSGSVSGAIGLIISNSKIYNVSAGSFSTDLTSLLLDNNWHLMTYVKAGTNYYLYVDGSHIGTKTGSDTGYDSGGYIGKGIFGTGQWHYFNGKMDNFRIYNKALNESEIQEIYNAKQ